MIQVLAVFCFHNRKRTTVACVQSLLAQVGLGKEFSIQMLAVDDGSGDDSARAIRSHVPECEIIIADGSWYWARSMAHLYSQAQQRTFDYLLMINDDVLFAEEAMQNALTDLAQVPVGSVLVGKTCDPRTGQWSYGGQRYRRPAFPLWFVGGDPGEGLQPVHTLNANFVLIPKDVVQMVPFFGNYSHAFSDIDYGLHLTRAGIPLYQSSHYVGTCARNPQRGTWLDESLPFLTRLRLLNTRKGMPWRDRLRYARRNGGWAWMWFFVHPYVKFCWKALVH